MISKLSNYLAKYIAQKGEISAYEIPIYEYGFRVFIELLIVLFTCFSITCLGGSKIFLYGIFFWGVFIPLRRYGGGVHLYKFGSCFVLSVLVYIYVIFTAMVLKSNYINCLIGYTLLLLLWCVQPLVNQNLNSILNKKDFLIKKYRRTIRAIGFIMLILALLKKWDYITVISTTLGLNMISLIVERIRRI